MKAKKKNKYTLNELGSRMDRFETKLDQIGDAVIELTKSFASFKQEVNDRFDRIETRIDGIDARLDYNNLKKLPISNYK